jgi:hypothetical protein
MSGKISSNSKYGTCAEYFSDGPPRDPEHDVMWQSCKGVLGESFLKKKAASFAAKDVGITKAQKEAVGEALHEAMDALAGKKRNASPAVKRCMEEFQDGPPRDLSSRDWLECKDQLPRDFFGSATRKMVDMLSSTKAGMHHRH